MRFGIRHGWLWSAALGAMFGYFVKQHGTNSRVLIAWLFVPPIIGLARLVRFALEEPGWWAAQVDMKGTGTVTWNAVRTLTWFTITYAVVMAISGLAMYFITGIAG